MLCPKCFGRLEPRFSREVEVDVCEDCGGIFLDRGELRKIIEGAEPVVLAGGGSAVQDSVPVDSAAKDADPVERRVEFEPSQADPRRRDRDDDDDDDRDRDDRKKKSKDKDSKKSKSKKSKKKRKKGWADMLEDVLDDVLDF